ncbi:MAG: hypothetical protein ABIS06_11025, partial [Vicinamibacterales bacterium]
SSDVFSTAFISRDKQIIYADGHLSATASPNQSGYTRGVFKNITGSIAEKEKLFQSESRLKALTPAPN